MRVSIAILAYNEAEVIAGIIESVFSQDIFTDPNVECQFLILTNGCTDNTFSIATETADNLVSNRHSINVVDIPVAGKSNAWNVFVHEASWQDADYLFLIDADIEIATDNALSLMLYQLHGHSQAWVATDIPKKDIEKKKNKNLLEKLSAQLSKVSGENKGRSITGQLYCISGERCREIYLPAGLPVEDGFLAAMVASENFTVTDNPITRVTIVQSASHYFEAFVNPIDLVKHEKRLMIGSTINAMVYNYLWHHVRADEQHAGLLIRELNASNPYWLNDLIEDYKKKRGFWFVPKALCFKHVHNWLKSQSSLLKKLFKLPLVLLVTLALLCLSLNVNLYFKKSNGVGHW